MILRKVKGHSLEPKFKDGDLVIGSRAKSVETGDVVVAQVDNREVIKVAGKVNDETVELLGKDSEHGMGQVPKDQIIARIIWPKRN